MRFNILLMNQGSKKCGDKATTALVPQMGHSCHMQLG